MKKIFYSMIAVALCSCAQSEVDDNSTTPPQPEKNGLKFEVANDGFTGEDGTRVKYGNYSEYGNAAAYQATFEEGDAIGIFAINTTAGMETDTFANNENAMTPADGAYIEKVKNAKLTLEGGVWKLTNSAGNSIGLEDFGKADLLFAYAPYDPNKTIPTGNSDGKPSFIQNADGSWAIYTSNSRFFTSCELTDCGDLEAFKAADMMGAVAKVPTSTDETVSLKMIHMRGMVEVTVDKDVTLTGLKLIPKDNPELTHLFSSPYLFATTSQNVYRILTTEYRNGFTVKAQIKDMEDGKEITKNYKKEIPASDAGNCSRLNIPYVKLITIGDGEGAYSTLEEALIAKYGDDYATDPTLKSLRLAGKLKGAKNTEIDWATLGKLTTLKKLDMSRLTNTLIPQDWMKNATDLKKTLTTLVLPNGLQTIGHDALQFDKTNAISIKLPASVTTLGGGAFWSSNALSVHIPEDSQLINIGNGAFGGVKAVYTDPENVNVLKIPASVTEIENNAFYLIDQLKKVIFQDMNTTPKIGNTGSHETFDDKVLIYVPKRDGYEGQFRGNTVIVGPVLTDANYTSTPNPLTGGGENGDGLPALCDNNISTFWRTPYSGDAVMGDPIYGQYIDITLPKDKTMSSLTVQYVTSKNNAAPTKIDIYTGTDGANWNKLFTLPKEGETLPTDNGVTSYTSEKHTAASSFTKIRFAITEANGQSLLGGTGVNSGTALAELKIGEEVWTETRATTPATPAQ